MGQLCAELNLKFKRNEKCIFLISDKGKALKIKNTIKEKSSTTFPVGTEIREHLVVYHQNKIIWDIKATFLSSSEYNKAWYS